MLPLLGVTVARSCRNLPGLAPRIRNPRSAVHNRELHTEGRSLSGPRLKRQPAAMIENQFARHEQSQAGAVLLRRKVRAEKAGLILRGDAVTVVAYRDLNAGLDAHDFEFNASFAPVV